MSTNQNGSVLIINKSQTSITIDFHSLKSKLTNFANFFRRVNNTKFQESHIESFGLSALNSYVPLDTFKEIDQDDVNIHCVKNVQIRS